MRSTKTVLRNLNSKKGACEMREKSQVEDIDRSIYDIRDEEKDAYIGNVNVEFPPSFSFVYFFPSTSM